MKRAHFVTQFVTNFVILAATLAPAQSGTTSINFTTWNGFAREYVLYVPRVLPPNPAIVMVLHGTTQAAPSNPPTEVFHFEGWDALADANEFLVVQPISTWKAIPHSGPGGGAFFWESFGTETFFPTPPDDSGFLANLAQTIQQQFSADPNRLFVMGFSSGGMMTQRVAIEHADLFAAAAPFSGTIFVGSGSTLTLPSQPVSIIEFHGDEDTTIPYCGGLFNGWGEGEILIPSIDTDLNYWLAADALASNSAPMCSNALPSAPGFDSGPAKVEVQMVREFGFAHTYKQAEIAMAWAFFSTHGR